MSPQTPILQMKKMRMLWSVRRGLKHYCVTSFENIDLTNIYLD